jgi:acylglycerol lipase
LEAKSPSKDKTVLFYDDLWHDVWHEEEIIEIMPKV